MASERRLVVLDTTVVSFLLRDDPEAAYYADQIIGMRPVISFQTLEESTFGAVKNTWGAARRSGLRQHLARYEVIWASPALVEISANLRAERERAGRKLSTADAWIAATAILLECPVASHDRDFSGIDNLELIRAPSEQP